MTEKRGKWKSKIGFILAAAGSAVGLGNIWKFPYITGENGGGLFVLIYLLCIILVGIPIMIAEIMIGRSAKKQPIGAFEKLQGGPTSWSVVGWLGVFAGFVILSYYIVVAGWAMDYTLKSIANFTNPIAQKAKTKAKIYRAKTPLNEMKKILIEKKANRITSEKLSEIKGKASKKVWTDFEIYNVAMSKSKDKKMAEHNLFEDINFKNNVLIANKLQGEIDKLKSKNKKISEKYYSKLSETQIRNEGETVYRRSIIAKEVGNSFGKVITDGWTASFWALIFMLINILVVVSGISGGIEKVCRILMPLLIGIMVFMVIYGMFQPGFVAALSFVFYPDPSKLKASGILEALGHAFFTLSLGMGAMITYGSYQENKENIFKQSIWIAILDTVIALLACLMLFPILFSYGLEPSAGPGLVFKSMPLAFTEIGTGGMLLAILFFSLLVVAALTSSISLLEVVASYFIDVRGWTRTKASWIVGGAIFLFALPSAFSWDSGFVLTSWSSTYGKSFFDTMDYLASNWLLPLGGLFIAIYAGWIMPKKLQKAEFEGVGKGIFYLWLMLIRFVTPILVTLVVLQKVGILSL